MALNEPNGVVIALVKLENLKANHNRFRVSKFWQMVVIALVKLENLKANHNGRGLKFITETVVIALVKLDNFKAGYNNKLRPLHSKHMKICHF